MSILPRKPTPTNWLAASSRKQIVVGMGGMIVSNDKAAQLVTYSLGSCVGITIYDPIAKVGGLLHAMLPDSIINPRRAEERPLMYVDTGIPAMFHAAYALGGKKTRMITKVCGGANFLDDKKIFNIGQRNIDATFEIFRRNRVKVIASETGGTKSRTIRLDLANGDFIIDIPDEALRLL